MILISLLIALAVDRYMTRSRHGYIDAWLSRWLGERPATRWLFIPALVLALLLSWLDSALLTFVVQTLVLTLALGKADLARIYHRFVAAGQRDDSEAMSLYLGMLTQRRADQDTLDTAMAKCQLWLNYRYYAAVIIIFVVLGAPGVLAYASLRWAAPNDACGSTTAGKCLHWADWLPVRVTTLCYLLVGDFARALPAWLKWLGAGRMSAQHYIQAVGQRAEELDSARNTLCTQGAIRLARRTSWCLLAAAAVLTLMGMIA